MVRVIQVLTVPGNLCPLYEYDYQWSNNAGVERIDTVARKGYPLQSNAKVWRLMGKTGAETFEKFPAALKSTNPVINLGVDKPAAWPDFSQVTVEANIRRAQNLSTELLFASITWQASWEYFKCVLISSRPLPWSFVGTVTWKFTRTNDKSVLGIETTDLELYVLSNQLPSFMLKDGVPLELLRMPTILPYWMAKDVPLSGWAQNFKNFIGRVLWQPSSLPTINLLPNNLPATWGPFVAHTLFRETRFWYDPENTGGSYSDAKQHVLWMDLWLSDMNGIERRNTAGTERYAINCDDLGCLVQVIASLGLQDSTSLQLVKFDKFGAIEARHLIGRDASATQPSSFDYHVVVVQDKVPSTPSTKVILDACYGPELGDRTFQQYTEARPNSTNALWGILDRSVKRVCFARDIRPAGGNNQPVNLFSLMETTLTPGLLPPFLARIGPVSSTPGFESTWTYHENGGEAHINIFRFANNEDLQNTFSGLSLAAPDGQYEVVKDVSSIPNLMKSKPGARLSVKSAYSNAITGNYLFVTIEGTLSVGSVTAPIGGLWQRLRSQVLSQLPLFVADANPVITGHQVSPVTDPAQKFRYSYIPIHVTLTLKASIAQTWRGFDVSSETNLLTLLNCSKSADNTLIHAEFVSSELTGKDTLKFTLFGSNLEGFSSYSVLIDLAVTKVTGP